MRVCLPTGAEWTRHVPPLNRGQVHGRVAVLSSNAASLLQQFRRSPGSVLALNLARSFVIATELAPTRPPTAKRTFGWALPSRRMLRFELRSLHWTVRSYPSAVGSRRFSASVKRRGCIVLSETSPSRS